METVVRYVRYNDSIKLAEIEISDEEKFSFQISEYTNEESGEIEKRLDIIAINSSVVPEGIKLSLSNDNVKELRALINQFASALSNK